MIAEIILTDEFKAGVEFSLTNQGAAKVGGFKLDSVASGLKYALTGTRGNINIDLFESNKKNGFYIIGAFFVFSGLRPKQYL